jgi:hypothetical protein
MARDTLLQSVRAAVRFAAFTVDTDNPYTNPKDLEARLGGAATWLTPQSVEGFRAQDFRDVPPEQQTRLREGVERFLGVAKEVPPKAPATREQIRAALPPFMQVVTTLKAIVLNEWKAAVEQLIRDAERWSSSRGWATKRDEKEVAEDFLGTYTLPRLLIVKDASRLVLDPAARFVPRAAGLVDLAVLPSYDSVNITRVDGGWYVGPVGGGRRKWSERAFVRIASELSKAA